MILRPRRLWTVGPFAKAAIPALAKLLKTREYQVRDSASQALGTWDRLERER